LQLDESVFMDVMPEAAYRGTPLVPSVLLFVPIAVFDLGLRR
jgi:hypothetical protein